MGAVYREGEEPTSWLEGAIKKRLKSIPRYRPDRDTGVSEHPEGEYVNLDTVLDTLFELEEH